MNRRSNATNSREDRVYQSHPAFEEERRREAWERVEQPFRRRAVYVQLALFALVLLLWKLPVINPVKLLVVLFHEFSHVLVAYLTGGVVFGIAIDPGGAGVTLGIGGSEMLILAAGYVGSLLIGFLLYALSAVWEPGDVWASLCILCCVSLVFGWLNNFTAVFGYGTIILLFVGFFVLSASAKKFFLRLVATASCLYPIIDVAGGLFQPEQQGFTIKGKVIGSDVSQLAGSTGASEVALIGLLVVVGLAAVILLMRWASKKDAETTVKRRLFRPRLRMQFEHPLYNPNDPSSVPEYTVR